MTHLIFISPANTRIPSYFFMHPNYKKFIKKFRATRPEFNDFEYKSNLTQKNYRIHLNSTRIQ